MIPGRSWQDHSKEICMICNGAIIWSDYDRRGPETREGDTLPQLITISKAKSKRMKDPLTQLRITSRRTI